MELKDRHNHFPAGEWLLEEARRLSVHERPPQPFLKGRHLLELGMKQGPSIGSLLKKAFNAQINGQIRSLKEALDWAKTTLPQESLTGKNNSEKTQNENQLIPHEL